MSPTILNCKCIILYRLIIISDISSCTCHWLFLERKTKKKKIYIFNIGGIMYYIFRDLMSNSSPLKMTRFVKFPAKQLSTSIIRRKKRRNWMANFPIACLTVLGLLKSKLSEEWMQMDINLYTLLVYITQINWIDHNKICEVDGKIFRRICFIFKLFDMQLGWKGVFKAGEKTRYSKDKEA